MRSKLKKWSQYPIGTKAFAWNGGYWEKTEYGWKWIDGGTFPVPGRAACRVVEPR